MGFQRVTYIYCIIIPKRPQRIAREIAGVYIYPFLKNTFIAVPKMMVIWRIVLLLKSKT